MKNETQSVETAAEVMKQLISIGTIIVAAVLGLLLTNKGNSAGHWPALLAVATGGVSVFLCLLFLTDIAAWSLGSTSKPIAFRRHLFIVSWTLFLTCIVFATIYVLLLSRVVT